MVSVHVSLGSKEHKYEPGWNGDFSHVTQFGWLGQSDKNCNVLVNSVYFSNQDIGSLCLLGKFLEKGVVEVEILKVLLLFVLTSNI